MQHININRNNKDRLFCYIFGREDHKDWTLSLYNAVNHTHYDDPERLIIFTIENVVYMSMKDDVAFLIQDNLNLYEQQSTFNPNMPVRMLDYLTALYNKYFTVLGDLGSGQYKIYKERMTIFQALAMTGDVNNKGDRKHVRIVRPNGNEPPEVLEFDIRSKSIIDSKYYYIYPNDLIYVSREPGAFYKLPSYSGFIGLITSSLALLVSVLNYIPNVNF